MNENLMDEVASDSGFNNQLRTLNTQEVAYNDNDSDSSIFNLLDTDLSDKTPEETFSPYNNMTESANHDPCHSKKIPIPDIKCETSDRLFESLILSKLPQIIAVEKASIQYEVSDQNYPCLSKSFTNCFNSPVLDLLVVVLNEEKLVSYYQGYFAGIPRLVNDLINLNSRNWKSLISNNDENAWDSHFKSVTEKFNSSEQKEPEFEIGPIIRCRLRASSKPQFHQQFNFFFIQPCSYMVQLPQLHHHCRDFDLNEDMKTSNVYMVSYINIMRECDTEHALKGSAAASLQKVITTSTNVHRHNVGIFSDNSTSKMLNNNRSRKPLNGNSGQLSINTSPPAYNTSEKAMSNAPLTYPLINDQQYSKQRSQVQHHVNQGRQPIQMNNNQYMSRGVAINVIDQNRQHYPTHYQVPQSPSTLQYILENQNPMYSNSKPMHNPGHHMASPHGQIYQHNTGRASVSCYLPQDHGQSISSNLSLSSPTSFMPSRQILPMSSNGILLSSDQYFKNNNQINVIDSVNGNQSMMTVVRSMSSTPNPNGNNYYCAATQSQLQQTPIHVINSMPRQSQFQTSAISSYCNNNKTEMMHMTSQPYPLNHIVNKMPLAQESYGMLLSQKDWNASQIMDDSIAIAYCGPSNAIPMTSDSISFDIVEEILKAEEAKSDNKRQVSIPNSDNSDPLSFDLDDFGVVDHGCRTQPQNVVSSQLPATSKNNDQTADNTYGKQLSKWNDSLWNLKSETLEKFTKQQKIKIKQLVDQHKAGKLNRTQMYEQINEFVSSTLGKNNHMKRVLEFWNTQHPNGNSDQQLILVDSSLSNLNCSHIVQSPEEGPGISPTEHAAQSTTDIGDDKDLVRSISKQSSTTSDLGRRRVKSKSGSKGVTSTTPTGVLETLLNEHDNPDSKTYANSNYSTKLSLSVTQKNQLSLDQLLMDDECSMLASFNPNHDDKLSRVRSNVEYQYLTTLCDNQRTSENPLRQLSSSLKSQPSTPSITGNMGVLESLLNQNNPSVNCIRQKSTESILKHSKPSRQNSIDTFHDDVCNPSEVNGAKKNSLLITLLNNSNGNTWIDKNNTANYSSANSGDNMYSASQPKRQRMLSGASISSKENNGNKKQIDDLAVFDFEGCELSCNNSDFQSGTVTSSQSMGGQKTPQNKRNRKRCYSKEVSIDSDGSSDKLSISEKTTSKSASKDKKAGCTSSQDSRKIDDSIISVATVDLYSVIDGADFIHPANRNHLNYDDSMDLEDIKIDDFDLEHLIDISDQMEDSGSNDIRTSLSQESAVFDICSTPIYTMVPPVINISQSDPIVPVSKQSIIRVSDKNSILFSAIQSTPSVGTISVECLDNERERLLKQQQHQKLSMGGKYVSLNQVGNADLDSQPTKNNPLSLHLLNKQMKEVGPNVMVEASNNVESLQPRKSSFSRVLPVISPINSAFPTSSSIIPTSPVSRSSSLSLSNDTQSDSFRLSSTASSHVNHQQVREGLRLLVSSRSAQNNSKNTSNIQRPGNPSLNELMSPNCDSNATRASATKSMIHYHSDSQVSSQYMEPSVSYSFPEAPPSQTAINDGRATNILEDSLVNDVFGLEELVNSKGSKVVLDSNSLPRTSSALSINGDSQMAPVSAELDMGAQSNPRQPHHHHHLPHYHHHHQHHHHHPAAPLSQPPSGSDASNASPTKSKPTSNSNSGLLETLLSK